MYMRLTAQYLLLLHLIAILFNTFFENFISEKQTKAHFFPKLLNFKLDSLLPIDYC